jgi:SnoaL-like domain
VTRPKYGPSPLVEVQAVQSAYCHAIDRCDPVAWADLFHPEGTSSGPDRPTLRGTAQLRQFLTEHPRPDFVHLTLNTVVTRLEGDTIWAAAKYVILQVGTEGITVAATGTYADVLERREGRLRFLSRVATPVAGS